MLEVLSDFIVFLGWIWTNTIAIFKALFLPVQYIYTFLQQFLASAFANPVPPEEIWVFNDEILSVFNSIPYFHILISAVVLGIIILMVIFIIKTFLRT